MTTFISYARPDGPFALRLATDLRAAAVDVWLDQLDIQPGDTWDQAVEQALKRCDTLLVVLTPRSVASRSVMDEVSYAIEENKRTLPVLLENCELPFRLRRLQHTDFTNNYDAALRRLLASFATREAHATEGGRSPSYPAAGEAAQSGRRVSRRTRLLIGLSSGLAGGLFSAVLQILIFAHDPRGINVVIPALAGGAIAALIWTIAGIIAGPRLEAWIGGIGVSILVLVGWISAFGTYQDVMSMAVIFGWPLGGTIGAWIGAAVFKYRARKHAHST
jgi:uncharacterized membrane protein YsdA (DUF1294 family)